jgi:hypothetical protein
MMIDRTSNARLGAPVTRSSGVFIHWSQYDSINKQVEDDFTFGDLQESDVFKAGLGFGDNTKALVEGIEQKRETMIPAGAMARI